MGSSIGWSGAKSMSSGWCDTLLSCIDVVALKLRDLGLLADREKLVWKGPLVVTVMRCHQFVERRPTMLREVGMARGHRSTLNRGGWP